MSDGALWRRKVQVGRQTVATAVAATRILYLEDFSLTNPRDSRPVQVQTGTRDNVRGHTQGPHQPGGSLSMRISAQEAPELLAITMKDGVTPTTPAGATLARRWVWTPGDLARVTFESFDGARLQQGVGYSGNTLTFDGSVDGDNTVATDLFGAARVIPWAGPMATLAERSVNWLEGWQVNFYLGAFGADPETFIAITDALMAWNIALGNNLGRVYTANNTQSANRVVAGLLDASANVTLDAVSATVAAELANWDTDAKRMLRISYVGPLIETGFNEKIDIDVPGAWAAPDTTGETQSVRSYQFPLSYVYDPTLGAGIRITVQNTRTTLFGAT